MAETSLELRERAKAVVAHLGELLGAEFNPDQRLDLINAVEKELVWVVLEARNNCAKAALATQTKHTDLAHEISRRIHRSNQVLITNLDSMR